MDAITLLRNDHKTVEKLFKRFEKAGDAAFVEKRRIVDRIIEELSVHAAIEEQVFYPVVRATVPDVEDDALESLEEHHIVKWVLAELDSLDPANERFDAKVTVLIENVRHHVEEEETELFPKVRSVHGRSAMADLGEALASARQAHRRIPIRVRRDAPPGNTVVDAISGVIDRVADNVSGVAQGSVTAIQDLIATMLNKKKPVTSPTGSSVARGRAKSVRSAAAAATDGVEQTARSVATGATSTGRAAKAGVKGTLTTAKKSTKATTTTAKRAATTTGRTAKKAAATTAATAKRSTKKTASAARR